MKLIDAVVSWSSLTYISNSTNYRETRIPRKTIHFDVPRHHNVVPLPPVIAADTTKALLPPFTKYDLSSRRIFLLQHVSLAIFPSLGHCEVIPPECRDGTILPGKRNLASITVVHSACRRCKSKTHRLLRSLYYRRKRCTRCLSASMHDSAGTKDNTQGMCTNMT